jgi:hypothetical protein
MKTATIRRREMTIEVISDNGYNTGSDPQPTYGSIRGIMIPKN